jgi:hypothetical protein
MSLIPQTLSSSGMISQSLHTAASPKRKRDSHDNGGRNASPMRIRTEVLSRDTSGPVVEPSSPRTRVSDQLQSLKLDKVELNFSVPILSFGQNNSSLNEELPTDWALSTPMLKINTESIESGTLAPKSASGSPQRNLLDTTPYIPETPVLDPTPSPTLSNRPISPLPLSNPRPRLSSPRNKLSTVSPKRIKSPPPFAVLSPGPNSLSDFVWSDSEITGHDPTDPSDDGYGINGIGFKPTPAMAYARSQKRKQQIADWKTREARDARQKRMERRKGSEKRNAMGKSDAMNRKVRFLEG